MNRRIVNTSRVVAAMVALFLFYSIGGFIASAVFPQSPRINRIETVSDKIGSSIGVVVVSFFLARYLFQSVWQAVACFVGAEVFAFLIILYFTGLWSPTWFDLSSNIGWLYTLTWNVAGAYFIGTAIGLKSQKRQ